MENKLLGIGEVLIDFTPAGLSASGNNMYEQNFGGGVANVLVAAARQGIECAMISCVGEDYFGDYLLDKLEIEGIDSSAVQRTEKAVTTMAFVSLDENGERSFCFSRKPGADTLMEKEKIPKTVFDGCGVLHFSSLSLSRNPSKDATVWAVKQAVEKGMLIAYDPNWRESIWPDKQKGIDSIKDLLPFSHIVKLSEEELFLLSGEEDISKGSSRLYSAYKNLKLIAVTLGDKGCFYKMGAKEGSCPAFSVKAVDTTGAGDSFWGTLLSGLMENAAVLEAQDAAGLEKLIKRACAAGAICTTGRGTIASIPTRREIDAYDI